PREFERPGTFVFEDCSDCLIAHSTIHRFTTDAGARILNRCHGISLNCLVLSDRRSGIVLKDTANTTISSCRVLRTHEGAADLSIDACNKNILLVGNAFSGKTNIAEEATAK